MDNGRSFASLDIHPMLKAGLSVHGIYRMTPVQEIVGQKMFGSASLIIKAPAGTGKTCAFSLVLLEEIARKEFVQDWRTPLHLPHGNPLAIVLAHSPELCQQICHEMRSIGRYLPLSYTSIISSIDMQDEWDDVARSNIIVATPGIVVKLIKKRKLKLFQLRVLVIDEWDKMITDPGLSRDIGQIAAKQAPQLKKVIASSATFSLSAYQSLVSLFKYRWDVAESDAGLMPKLSHYIIRAGSFEKRIAATVRFLRSIQFQQAIVFCNLKQVSADAEKALNDAGITAASLGAHVDQVQRMDRVAEFRDLQIRCLVTTDIAARGIDVKTVNVIVSLDFPYENTTFLHRVGRAGRFGHEGVTLTFYKRQESKRIHDIKEELHISFSPVDWDKMPALALPSLMNETQLRNFMRFTEPERSPVTETSSGGDFIFEEGYWDVYKKLSSAYAPPLPSFQSN